MLNCINPRKVLYNGIKALNPTNLCKIRKMEIPQEQLNSMVDSLAQLVNRIDGLSHPHQETSSSITHTQRMATRSSPMFLQEQESNKSQGSQMDDPFAQYQANSDEFRQAVSFEGYLTFFGKNIDQGRKYYK